MLKIDYNIECCAKESQLLELMGKDSLKAYFEAVKKEYNNTCACCEFQPAPNQRLKLHVVSVNQEKPEMSPGVPLCEACFALKHFEGSVKKQEIKLVNSVYSQGDLLKIQRQSNARLKFEEDRKKIMGLKKSPEEYLKEILEDPKLIDPKIKVLFGRNLAWINCK